jgi:hypothetical protein
VFLRKSAQADGNKQVDVLKSAKERSKSAEDVDFRGIEEQRIGNWLRERRAKAVGEAISR